MAKNITFNHKGETYVLEFTRKTRTQMEERGFDASAIITQPMVVLPALFRGAFQANHRFVKPELIDEMYGLFTNKRPLVEKLAEMYAEPFEAMMDEPDEGNGIAWDASF